MKKIVLLLVLALGLSFVTTAQINAIHVKTGVNFAKSFSSTGVSSKSTTDTLWPAPINTASACGDSSTLYIFSDNSYVTGNNSYGFTEIGTRINHTGSGSVTSVYAALLREGSVGTGTCAIKIYSSTNNAPGTLLGTSTPITLSTLSIDQGALVPFTFTTPVAISGDFFATVLLPTDAGDTIAVFSTPADCTPAPDSLSMFYYSGTCYYYNSMVGFNASLFIAAIVNEGPAGIATNNAIENLNVYSSDNKIVVKNYSSSVIKQVMIYNILGQEVGNYAVNNSGTVTLDANLPAANYIVKVITDSKVGTYKLYVNR